MTACRMCGCIAVIGRLGFVYNQVDSWLLPPQQGEVLGTPASRESCVMCAVPSHFVVLPVSSSCMSRSSDGARVCLSCSTASRPTLARLCLYTCNSPCKFESPGASAAVVVGAVIKECQHLLCKERGNWRLTLVHGCCACFSGQVAD